MPACRAVRSPSSSIGRRLTPLGIFPLLLSSHHSRFTGASAWAPGPAGCGPPFPTPITTGFLGRRAVRPADPTHSRKGNLEKGLGARACASLGAGMHEVKSELWLMEMLTVTWKGEKGKSSVSLPLI